MLMNTLIFIDLYFTLENPFYQRKSRKKWYFSLIVADILLNMIFLEFGWTTSSNIIGSVIAQTTIFITFILVVKRLRMKGTSSELRSKVVTRHVTYFVCYSYILIFDTYRHMWLGD